MAKTLEDFYTRLDAEVINHQDPERCYEAQMHLIYEWVKSDVINKRIFLDLVNQAQSHRAIPVNEVLTIKVI